MKPTLYDIPTSTAGRLVTMPRPRGGDWLDDEMASLRAAGIDVVISLQTRTEQEELDLLGEPAAATHAGLDYRAFPIPDLGVPTGNAVVPLVAGIIEALRAGRNVAVHCRAGIGRSSLIAGAALVAFGAAPAEAWAVIHVARGVRVPETPVQGAWLDAWPAIWSTYETSNVNE